MKKRRGQGRQQSEGGGGERGEGGRGKRPGVGVSVCKKLNQLGEWSETPKAAADQLHL